MAGCAGIGGVGVQQLDQGSGPVVQALLLPMVMAVHVPLGHVSGAPAGGTAQTLS